MCGRCGGCLTKCNKGQLHSVDPKQGDADSMRHGQFNFEVRGDDKSSPVAHDRPDLARMGTRTNPAMNQAENGYAGTSAFGVALHRNAAVLVRQMNPLVYLYKFRNAIGVTIARNANNNTIVYDTRYEGILPMTAQPTINKPTPY